MIRRAMLITGLLIFSGCSKTLQFSTDNTRSMITDMYTKEVVDNIGPFISDWYAVPQFVSLGAGSATVTNSLSTGIAPNIALRAIAITGLSLSNVAQLGQGWALKSSDAFDQISRMQLLYGYALGKFDEDFQPFETEFSQLPPAIGLLSASLGGLPHSGFIKYNKPGQEPVCDHDNPTTTRVDGYTICFSQNQMIETNYATALFRPELSKHYMSAVELRSHFVAWVMAISTVAPIKAQQGNQPPQGAEQAAAHSALNPEKPNLPNSGTRPRVGPSGNGGTANAPILGRLAPFKLELPTVLPPTNENPPSGNGVSVVAP